MDEELTLQSILSLLNTVYICLEGDIFLLDLPMLVKCHWYLWLPEGVNKCDKKHVQPSPMQPHCNESREILWKMFEIKPRISTHYILIKLLFYILAPIYPCYSILLMIFVTTGSPSCKITGFTVIWSLTCFVFENFHFCLDYRSRAKLTWAKTWQMAETIIVKSR